ncbi:MAG: type II secretion system protein, partial [Limisphaerales bacterium]
MDLLESDIAAPARNISHNTFGVRAPVPRDRFRRVPPPPKTPVDWAHSCNSQPRAARRSPGAFTLIELLVVMAVISILAALIIPIGKAVNRRKIISKSRAELAQAETAIEGYKEGLGHYPPDNNGHPNVNQLYFELKGTTNTGTIYSTLDGSAQISSSAAAI